MGGGGGGGEGGNIIRRLFMDNLYDWKIPKLSKPAGTSD